MRCACLAVLLFLVAACGSDASPTIGAPDRDGGGNASTDGGGVNGDGGGGVDGGGGDAGGVCGAAGASCTESEKCCSSLVCQSRGPNPKPAGLQCCVPTGGACNDLADCCMPPEGPAIQITCDGDAGQKTCQSNAL